MPKNRHKEAKVYNEIENRIHYIKESLSYAVGINEIAEVLRELTKIIKSQQKQIVRLEVLFASNDVGRTKKSA